MCYNPRTSQEVTELTFCVELAAMAATASMRLFYFLVGLWRSGYGVARLASFRSAGSLVRQLTLAAAHMTLGVSRFLT
jgi:hypothetical protein